MHSDHAATLNGQCLFCGHRAQVNSRGAADPLQDTVTPAQCASSTN